MAYGQQVWLNKELGNSYFQVKIYYAYRQDVDARKTEIYTHSMEIIPLGGANIGYPQASTIEAGVGILNSDYDEKKFTNVQARYPGKYTYNFKNIYATFKHQANGKLEKSVYLQAKHKITTYVGSAPSFGWTNVDITADIPAMKALPNVPSGGNLTVNAQQTAVTMSYSGFNIPGGLDHYDVAVQEQGFEPQFINNKKEVSYVKAGLKPNKNYTAYVKAVDKYGQSSNTITKNFTTRAYSPTSGKISISEIGPFQALASASGFAFGAGGSWGYYEFSIQEQGYGDNWINTGHNAYYRRTNLKPNTTYNAKVRLVDNYGQNSDVVKTQFTTPSDQAKAWINDSIWKLSKSWLNDNIWKKVKKIHVNGEDGVWRKCK